MVAAILEHYFFCMQQREVEEVYREDQLLWDRGFLVVDGFQVEVFFNSLADERDARLERQELEEEGAGFLWVL